VFGLSKAIKIDASNRDYGSEIIEHEDGSHLHVEAFGPSSACAIGSINLLRILRYSSQSLPRKKSLGKALSYGYGSILRTTPQFILYH
jgi:hypothetical protein